MDSIQDSIGKCIEDAVPWERLSARVKAALGESSDAYAKAALDYCIDRRLPYGGSLVESMKLANRNQYYERVLKHSMERLRIFPYELSDDIICQLRMTPFQYDVDLLLSVMKHEWNYDRIPNFTAADCVRLVGIGRNQFIDIMNKVRGRRWLWRLQRSALRDNLPQRPEEVRPKHWWKVAVAHAPQGPTAEMVEECDKKERDTLELLYRVGEPMRCGDLEHDVLVSLYRQQLVYFNVPVEDNDRLSMPPLQGFVMNRNNLVDPIEKNMYDVFVSVDGRSSTAQLAKMLEMNPETVKAALSIYCRLGFAEKVHRIQRPTSAADKELSPHDALVKTLHPSWEAHVKEMVAFVDGDAAAPLQAQGSVSDATSDLLNSIGDLGDALPSRDSSDAGKAEDSTSAGNEFMDLMTAEDESNNKRIGFLFDSSLTAFLMMGNLTTGLKNHAVTLFEAGKLTDQFLDSLLNELDKVVLDPEQQEGEARRYFEHAITLRDTLRFLRQNPLLGSVSNYTVDMVRCESLASLDPATRMRLLDNSYDMLISMAPLMPSALQLPGCVSRLYGPAISDLNSPWFRLYMYITAGIGPPTILLPKGIHLRTLPDVFLKHEQLLMCVFDHEPEVVRSANVLHAVNDTLQRSPVLLQVYGEIGKPVVRDIAFPIVESIDDVEVPETVPDDTDDLEALERYKTYLMKTWWFKDEALRSLVTTLRDKCKLHNTLGFLRVMRVAREYVEGDVPGKSDTATRIGMASSSTKDVDVPDTGIEEFLEEGEDNTEDVEQWREGHYVWVPLEFHFGLPLFSARLNRCICEEVVSQDVFSKEVLEEHHTAMRVLCTELLSSIDNKLRFPASGETDPKGGGEVEKRKKMGTFTVVQGSSNTATYPTHVVYFNGKKVVPV